MKELKVQALLFSFLRRNKEFKHTNCTPPREAQVIDNECEQHKQSHYCRSWNVCGNIHSCVFARNRLMLVSSDQWPGASVRSPGPWLQPVPPQSVAARFVSICRSCVVPLYFLEPLQGHYKPTIVFKITFDWRQAAFADWTVDLHHWMQKRTYSINCFYILAQIYAHIARKKLPMVIKPLEWNLTMENHT